MYIESPKDMIKTKKGMHIEQFKHSNYDEIVEIAESFIVVNQFDASIEQGLHYFELPNCLTGQIVYANIDGTFVQILALIDSSD